MADTTASPNGCRHCGIDRRVHYTVCASQERGGVHQWVQPTTDQIRERMLARRAARQANLPLETERPTPPPIVLRCPECSLCGEETNAIDDYFSCDNCDVTWPNYDLGYANGEWSNPEIPRCQEVAQPLLHNQYVVGIVRRARRFQCVLDEEHVQHKIPHLNPDMYVPVKGWR